MPFADIDVNYADHPKNAALSDAAFRLHTAGILYCARVLTDGLIPADEVRRLVRKFKPSALAELVQNEMWLPRQLNGKDRADLYEIRDYLQWNKPREVVLARREAASDAARKRWEKERRK